MQSVRIKLTVGISMLLLLLLLGRWTEGGETYDQNRITNK
jgi:hypothetical protein